VIRPGDASCCLAAAALIIGLTLACQADESTTPAPAGPGAESPALLVSYPAKALLLDIAHAGPRLIAVGVQGVIIVSDDAGSTWTQVPCPVSSMLTCVAFADERRGWAAGHGGVIVATADGGRSWTRTTVPTTTDDSFLDMLALNDGRVLAAGAYGLFLASSDAGATWQRRPALDEELHINRITAGASGTLYLAAEAGTLARSSDRGDTWERLEIDYEGSFYGLHELSSGRLLAHGLRGHIHVSDDHGASWSQAVIKIEGLVATIAETTPGTIVATGAGGKLHISRDNGTTFAAGPATGLTSAAEVIGHGTSVTSVGDAGVRTLALPQP
jgi:photosystem II stability/assembly factor-like uncharacterized protein